MEFRKFSCRFDSRKLIDDFNKCQQMIWLLHFNKTDYTGTWSSFSLRLNTGKEDDILATLNASFIDTETFSLCHYFQEIVHFFECEK